MVTPDQDLNRNLIFPWPFLFPDRHPDKYPDHLSRVAVHSPQSRARCLLTTAIDWGHSGTRN